MGYNFVIYSINLPDSVQLSSGEFDIEQLAAEINFESFISLRISGIYLFHRETAVTCNEFVQIILTVAVSKIRAVVLVVVILSVTAVNHKFKAIHLFFAYVIHHRPHGKHGTFAHINRAGVQWSLAENPRAAGEALARVEVISIAVLGQVYIAADLALIEYGSYHEPLSHHKLIVDFKYVFIPFKIKHKRTKYRQSR